MPKDKEAANPKANNEGAKGQEREKITGQDQPAIIRNPATGETRNITNAQWREEGQDLRALGFAKVEEGEPTDEQLIDPQANIPSGALDEASTGTDTEIDIQKAEPPAEDTSNVLQVELPEGTEHKENPKD